MIHKQLASTCEKVRVTFELPSCLWADRIFVPMGCTLPCNGWPPSMQKDVIGFSSMCALMPYSVEFHCGVVAMDSIELFLYRVVSVELS